MRRPLLLLGLSALALTIVADRAAAQMQGAPPAQPRLLVVAPPGGRAGTTVEIALSGQDLDAPQALLFSHPGFQAEYVPPPEPPRPDPKKPAPPRQPPGQPPPVKFKVSIDVNVPTGQHDVRLVNAKGVSNPRCFVVGDLPELAEKEPNNDVPEAQRIPLGCVVNGAINNPTDVDYFVFAGQKGQRVLLHCQASSIDSRLHPKLQIFDDAGRELVANRYHQGTDALADLTLTADGDYHVRLTEFTHTSGGDDHFYRLRVGTFPWVDAVFPPMVEPGKPATLTVLGRNLPGGKPAPGLSADGRPLEQLTVTVTPPAGPAARVRLDYAGHLDPVESGLDGFEHRLRGPGGESNPYLLTYATAPVVLEKEGNDRPQDAQNLPTPCELAGRIDRRGDRDWYRFTAKKGDVLMIELFADRLGMPADLYFALRRDDPKSTNEEEYDDNPLILHPQQFYTRTGDPPAHRFVAPADGAYLLRVACRDSGAFGPRIQYRLRIGPEQPDFRLIAMAAGGGYPDATVLERNGQQLIEVFVWRRDGFDGPVTLTAEGLPAGVTASSQVLSGGASVPGRPPLVQGGVVLVSAGDAKNWTGALRVKGSAVIDGKTVEREARPASVTWPGPLGQNNIPVIARLDRQLVLAVREAPAPFRLTPDVTKVTTKQGQKVPIKVKIARAPDVKGPLQLAPQVRNNTFLVNNNQPITVTPDKAEISTTLDVRADCPPGTYTLLLIGQTIVPFTKEQQQLQRRPLPNALIQAPALPVVVTVLPTAVAKVTAAAKGNVRVGTIAEVGIRIERLNGYAGPFTVKLVVPDGVSGVTARQVTVPAGATEATLPVEVAARAKLGPVNNLVVQVTAQYPAPEKPEPLTAEAKFNLTVVK